MNPFKYLRALFTSAPRVQPRECAERVRSGAALLVDVREAAEWERGIADQAVLLSFKDLLGSRKQWTDFLAGAGQRELLLYCAMGGRAAVAARVLVSEGFRAANTGSLSDWQRFGWPVIKPHERGQHPQLASRRRP